MSVLTSEDFWYMRATTVPGGGSYYSYYCCNNPCNLQWAKSMESLITSYFPHAEEKNGSQGSGWSIYGFTSLHSGSWRWYFCFHLGDFFFSFFHSFSHWSKRKMTIVWHTWFLDHLEFLKKWTEIDRYVFSRVERRIKGGASSECWLLYIGHCCFSTEASYSAGSTPIHSPDSVILIFEWV